MLLLSEFLVIFYFSYLTWNMEKLGCFPFAHTLKVSIKCWTVKSNLHWKCLIIKFLYTFKYSVFKMLFVWKLIQHLHTDHTFLTFCSYVASGNQFTFISSLYSYPFILFLFFIKYYLYKIMPNNLCN